MAWTRTPYADETGLLLETLEQKHWFTSHCDWVIIDLRRSRNPYRPPARHADPVYEPIPTIHAQLDVLESSQLAAAELRQSWLLHRALVERTAHVLQTFHDSARLDMEAVNEVVGELADALDDCLGGLVWLTRIKETDHYTAQHVVNTAILSAGLTHAMGWGRERVETAGQVGMLHDIGKARIDHVLLNKSGPLSEEEVTALRRHVIVGYDLLKTHRDVPTEVLSAVRSSHERIDGSGYPRGLKGNSIPAMSRLIAIVDAYDAMASYRPHGNAMSHQQALGELWRARDSQFEPQLVEAFIQFLGWVPPGTLVRLSDGQVGVVMKMHRAGVLRPVVRTIHRQENQLMLGPEQELAGRLEADTESDTDAPQAIRDILPDGSEKISMRALTAALMRLYESGEGDSAAASMAAGESRDQGVPGWSLWKFSGLRALFGRRDQDSVTGQGVGAAGKAALRRRVLVVDDSEVLHKVLSRALTGAGHEVEIAASGEECLERARAEPPEVIFLDIVLPGMNGFETLQQLRKDPAMADVPVVMISDNPQATEQFFLGQIGAEDFLPKPFHPEDVSACLQRLAAAGRLSRSAAAT